MNNESNRDMKFADDRKKVLGAWLGKAVGGTLGQPWEGSRGPLTLSFYDPVPTKMMPNDDLDLQVVWACRLATDWNGIVSLANFSDAWLNNIDFPCDEYGIVIRNLKLGIPAPYTGRYGNWFTDGLGGAIRAELWAVLSPGLPERAARLAGMDASLDHYGNGIYAEQFLAALESCAFIESDLRKLIAEGLSQIPEESRLYQAVSDTVSWCGENKDFQEIRHLIMTHYGSPNFTDVKMNLAFVTAALLLGNGNFEQSICHAVNFGQDADCTGATVGAILGIIDPDSIPERWLAPIGRNLVINDGISGINAPSTLDEFTDLAISLREKLRIEDVNVKEPDFAEFRIPFRRSVFRPWFTSDFRKFTPSMIPDSERIMVPGNLFTVDFTTLQSESLLMLETEFELDSDCFIRILVNTPANMRVWVDGTFCFGRESGTMIPAFHRAPLNQLTELHMCHGSHKLLIGLAPADEAMKQAEVLFGIADENNQWLPDVFYKR